MRNAVVYSQGSAPVLRNPYATFGAHQVKNQFFHIFIVQQPEGIWLATSGDIPGLFVEGDTVEEARSEATQWGRELLADNLGIDPSRNVVLVFEDGRERVYTRA